jgi:glycosyltransferase involved in cell wall biosynthesis
MSASEKVSVIVLMQNNVSMSQRCLKALSKAVADLDHEVILLDNASTEDTEPLRECASLSQRFQFFRSDEAVPDPYQHLADYDLFVLASRSYNLPVAFLEAMLAGLPIVATDVGGAADLLTAVACGRAVPPDSSGALAQAMLSIAH